MATIEELEKRVNALEILFSDILKERIIHIESRLDDIYEKTERDKTELKTEIAERIAELYEKTERDKTELKTEIAQKIAELYEKTERDKTEILAKTERDKRELIYWMVGLFIGFLTLNITALWAILNFALKG